MKSVTYNIAPRHCTECGTRMLIRERLGRNFDKRTGERETVIEQVCPQLLDYERRERGFFSMFNSWKGMTCDRTQVFHIESVDLELTPAEKARMIARIKADLGLTV